MMIDSIAWANHGRDEDFRMVDQIDESIADEIGKRTGRAVGRRRDGARRETSLKEQLVS